MDGGFSTFVGSFARTSRQFAVFGNVAMLHVICVILCFLVPGPLTDYLDCLSLLLSA